MILGKGIAKLGGLMTVGRLLQIASALVLIKFLNPYQMGIIAFLTAVFVGIYSVVNFGFDRYLIYADDENIGHETVNNIWTLQLIRGVFVFAVCAVIAFSTPALTDFSSEITAQIIFIGLALFIQNTANPEIALNERNGDFNQIALCRGISTIAGSLAILFLIYFFKNPWIYVAGKLVQTFIYSILTFYYSTTKPRLSLNIEISRKVVHYCKHLLVISMVSVISVQFENYYITFAFGAEALGYYYAWARLVFMPRELLTQISDRILFAKACSARRENMNLYKEHLFIITLAFAIILPFYSIIWLHGEWFISVFAGEEWAPYHWIGKVFIVISIIYLIALLFSPIILSHFPKLSSQFRLFEAILLIFLVVFLGEMHGVLGVLMASLITISLATVIRLFIAYKHIFTNHWRAHLLISSSTIIIGILILSLEMYWAPDEINSSVGFGTVATFILFWVFMGIVSTVIYKSIRKGC